MARDAAVFGPYRAGSSKGELGLNLWLPRTHYIKLGSHV